MKIIKKLFSIVFVALVFFLFIGFTKVYAWKVSFNINSKALYDQTNTYNYKYAVTLPDGIQLNNGIDRDFEGESRYYITDENGNLLEKNGNQVMLGIPQITVFTHGWQGNDGSWGYGSDSLVYLLSEQLNANIYTLDFPETYSSKHEFVLLDSTDLYVNGGKSIEVNTVDTTKPAILVFNGANTGYRHDYIYTQFNYAVSKVVYEYKRDNGGLLPRLNLIGHSRGGLTNMQYALDHPDMVASLFSFGTPYLGTTTAELDFNNLSIGDEHSLGMRLAEFFLNVPKEEKDCYGEQDLADPSLYMKFVNRWNTYYDQLYSGIFAYALGGVTSLEYLMSLIENKLFVPLFNKLVESYGVEDAVKITFFLESSLQTIILTTLNLAYVGGMVSSSLNAKAMLQTAINDFSYLNPAVAAFVNATTGVLFDALDLIYTELEMRPFCDPFIVWNSDFAVNIESQMAKRVLNGTLVEYKGFNRHYVTFTPSNTFADNITHNKEMFNPELQKYVLNNITQAPYWAYTLLGGNNVSIDGYYDGSSNTSKLVIPSTITTDGKTYTVKGISDYAFANDAYGKKYSEIVIPSTVESIGYKAFYNSPSLTKVDLSNVTSLKYIGEACFGLKSPSDTSGLSTMVLPDSVERIGAKAFVNNKRLKEINIPTNTTSLGEGAFLGTSISKITGNSCYAWDNGILIDKTGSDSNRNELVYASPLVKNVSVPNNVTSISAYAFRNNTNIESISLNNVKTIGVQAFFNCENLKTITNYGEVENADVSAFTYTKWLLANKNDTYLALGKVLLSYYGTEEEIVVPSGIERIGAHAFNSATAKNIELPETISSIGRQAFMNCPNLDYVLFKSSNAPRLDGECFNSNTEILVSKNYLQVFQKNVFFKDIDNEIKVLEIKINFYDENGNYLETRTEEYGSLFDNYPELSKDGYDFKGFLDFNGNAMNPNGIIRYTKEQTLRAVFEKSKYVFEFAGGSTYTAYNINEKLNVSIPSKNGYKFLGWYDNQEGRGSVIVDATGRIKQLKNCKLYPVFEVIEYKVKYDYSSSTIMAVPRYTFSVEDPLVFSDIPEVRRFGFVFSYWNIKQTNKAFESTDGIYNDITLEAKWLGTLITDGRGTITEKYAVIDMRFISTGTFNFTITNQVDYATFIGLPNRELSMTIYISTRSTALVLGFENINFGPGLSTSGQGADAIKSNGKFDLYVIYSGTNTIRGGRGSSGSSYTSMSQATDNSTGKAGATGRNGFNGGNGFNVYSVTFQEYDPYSSIKVTGGAGGNGGTGQNGQKGSNGVNPPRGWFWGPVKGDNGANGGYGGDGGRGGNGGYAIKVTNKTGVKVASASHYEFVGGAGGTGGRGGRGGDGGDGASDTSANIFNGVGDPGDGGNGGRGGNGGSGGTGSDATNALYVKGTGGAGGAAGAGGAGGAAGNGGYKGTIGGDGARGSSGSYGSYGSTGLAGSSGVKTNGDSRSTKDLRYLFKLDTLNDLNCRLY